MKMLNTSISLLSLSYLFIWISMKFLLSAMMKEENLQQNEVIYIYKYIKKYINENCI
jgi:hypothetical protein